MRPIGNHRRAVDREDVAVARVVLGLVTIEDLHFDRLRERSSRRGERLRPDEESGVALGPEVHPLELDDEVLVLPLGAEEARRHTCRRDHPIAHGECLGRAVDVDPAREIAAVEERHEAGVVGEELDRDEDENGCEDTREPSKTRAALHSDELRVDGKESGAKRASEHGRVRRNVQRADFARSRRAASPEEPNLRGAAPAKSPLRKSRLRRTTPQRASSGSSLSEIPENQTLP
jgi:hypothetical protein